MAAGIFIASYQLEIRQTGSDTALPLEFAQGKSLYAEINRILTGLCGGYAKDDKDQSLLRVRHAALAAGAAEPGDGTRLGHDATNLWGMFHRGEYGYVAPFVNAETFAPSIRREVNDAELLPFYFRFHLPPKEQIGLLLLERVGNKSPYGQLRSALQTQFRDSNPGYHLAIDRIVPASVIKALMEGQVRTFRITLHGKTGDKTDTFLRGHDAQIGTMERVWRAPRKQSMFTRTPKFITDITSGRAKVAKFFGEDVDSVRIGVDYNGRTRQYDIGGQGDAAPYLEITEDIALEHGHPTFASLDQCGIDLITELREQLDLVG